MKQSHDIGFYFGFFQIKLVLPICRLWFSKNFCFVLVIFKNWFENCFFEHAHYLCPVSIEPFVPKGFLKAAKDHMNSSERGWGRFIRQAPMLQALASAKPYYQKQPSHMSPLQLKHMPRSDRHPLSVPVKKLSSSKYLFKGSVSPDF
jgi:hypothetical protein